MGVDGGPASVAPLPATVRDPRRWLGWAFHRLPALGGGYGICAAVGVAGVHGSLARLGHLGFASLYLGLAIGAVAALACAALDVFLVARVRPVRARAATTWANGVVGAALPGLLLLDTLIATPVLVPLLTIGPGLAVGMVTWRSSPAAVAVTG